MNSIRHILVLSSRDEFREKLSSSAEEFFDVRLQLSDGVAQALELLDSTPIEVVVIDNAPQFDVDAAMDELVPVIDSMSPTPLLCFVGQRSGVEMEASLVFTRDASAEELLGELSGVPTWSRRPDETFDSAEQPRFIVPDSGFRHPSTSGHFSGLVRRIMYVGDRMGFRQGLAAQSESRGVELILRDSPSDVVWPKGAQSLSVVAIEVHDDFEQARRLVGYLRERHATSDFRVAFIEPDDHKVSGAVSEILGADYLLDYDTTPKELFDTVFERDEMGIKGRMLVVSSRNGLIRTIETVLGSDGMVIDVRRRLDEILAYVDESAPEIVLFDGGSRALDANELAARVLRERPFLRARLLGISQAPEDADAADDEDGQLEEISTSVEDLWDLTVRPPVSGEDLRRAVNLLLLDVERGKEIFEHDSLTRVRRPAGLPDTIAQEMAAAAEADENLLIVGLDIDDLSLLNVRYSWRLGDAVLRTLADTLSVAVGGREKIFRHDDMFFVVRRGDQEACQAVRGKIEDFIELFQRQTFRSEDGRGTYATVSGGAVIVPPLDIPPETVLEKCWIVLKRACSSRRNNLLVAQLDPESFPSVASREKAGTGDGE